MRAFDTRLAPVCLYVASMVAITVPSSGQQSDYSVSVTDLEADLNALLEGPALSTAVFVDSVLRRLGPSDQAIEETGNSLLAAYGEDFTDLGVATRYIASYDQRSQSVLGLYEEKGSFRISHTTQNNDVAVTEQSPQLVLSSMSAPAPPGALVHFVASPAGRSKSVSALQTPGMTQLVDTIVAIIRDLPSGDLMNERALSELQTKFPGTAVQSQFIGYKYRKHPVTCEIDVICCNILLLQVPTSSGLIDVKIAESTFPFP